MGCRMAGVDVREEQRQEHMYFCVMTTRSSAERRVAQGRQGRNTADKHHGPNREREPVKHLHLAVETTKKVPRFFDSHTGPPTVP
jgi:hypothetical protein